MTNPAEPAALTGETVDFLLLLLDSIGLSGADPEIAIKAGRITQARAELRDQATAGG